METYSALHGAGTNLTLVPVMISYDRIFEHKNMAYEMINGSPREYNIVTALAKLYSEPADNLGQIYLKYLDPINLE